MITALAQTTRNEDEQLALAALSSLGRMGSPSAVKSLIAALQNLEHDGDRRCTAARWLLPREARSPMALNALISALYDEISVVRLDAASALGEFRTAPAIAGLIGVAGMFQEALMSCRAVVLQCSPMDGSSRLPSRPCAASRHLRHLARITAPGCPSKSATRSLYPRGTAPGEPRGVAVYTGPLAEPPSSEVDTPKRLADHILPRESAFTRFGRRVVPLRAASPGYAVSFRPVLPLKQ